MADTYLWYQSIKQFNAGTDPLTEILNNINKNPTAYINAHAPRNNSQISQYPE